MRIGVVTEIKVHESRVALTPAGAHRLAGAGHEVFVQSGAGVASGLSDEAYRAAGARLEDTADAVFATAELILKVKEPQPIEWRRMRAGQTMFTYFHLAAERGLTDGVMATGSHCFAYETLVKDGTLPLLTPMSEVAGRMAIQAGAHYLEKAKGGSGILLGGVPGVPRARVLVLGGGVVGTQAARMAAGLGADVTVVDLSLDRLRYLDEILPANCRTLYSTPLAIREELTHSDLVVGAVLIPGAAAPRLVRREDLKTMKPGSVIVDVAVDQGGCIETCRPTTHAEPTFVIDEVVHYCVANMPGAVPRTSTLALTNATLPYTLELAKRGFKQAVLESPELRSAANVLGGKVTHRAVAETFGLAYVAPETAVAAL